MNDFSSAARLAVALILRGDPNLYAIVRLSLEVSLAAALIAGAFGALPARPWRCSAFRDGACW